MKTKKQRIFARIIAAILVFTFVNSSLLPASILAEPQNDMTALEDVFYEPAEAAEDIEATETETAITQEEATTEETEETDLSDNQEKDHTYITNEEYEDNNNEDSLINDDENDTYADDYYDDENETQDNDEDNNENNQTDDEDNENNQTDDEDNDNEDQTYDNNDENNEDDITVGPELPEFPGIPGLPELPYTPDSDTGTPSLPDTPDTITPPMFPGLPQFPTLPSFGGTLPVLNQYNLSEGITLTGTIGEYLTTSFTIIGARGNISLQASLPQGFTYTINPVDPFTNQLISPADMAALEYEGITNVNMLLTISGISQIPLNTTMPITIFDITNEDTRYADREIGFVVTGTNEQRGNLILSHNGIETNLVHIYGPLNTSLFAAIAINGVMGEISLVGADMPAGFTADVSVVCGYKAAVINTFAYFANFFFDCKLHMCLPECAAFLFYYSIK